MLIPNTSGVTETLKVDTIIGCILILVGMLISEFKLKKNRPAEINDTYYT